MGIRRVNTWRRNNDRSGHDYSALPDDDLLTMQPIARSESAIYLYDGRGMFLDAMDRTGLYAINRELWQRGIRPQEGNA